MTDSTTLHPYCQQCGWRKGGRDSWNGKACKCGETAPPMRIAETGAVVIVSITRTT